MVGKGGNQNAQHDGPGLAEPDRQDQREQLGFVTHFGQRHDAGRYQKSFHRLIVPGQTVTRLSTDTARLVSTIPDIGANIALVWCVIEKF